MRFGKSAEEAEQEPTRGGGAGGFMKYMKDGDNYLHIVDEPDKWLYYWEHYNPGGYPFPCTNERDTCPGCTSDNEKMKKASRRIALNAFDGEYTNVWKIPKTVADKLKNRSERLGTITDRPYTITRLKDGTGEKARYDYDVEGGDKQPLPDEVNDHVRNPEELLAQAYDEAWGTSDKTSDSSPIVKANKNAVQQQMSADAPARPKIVRAEPKEEKVVTEEELRKMEPWDLFKLCEDEGFGPPPKENSETTNSIVDWMLAQ